MDPNRFRILFDKLEESRSSHDREDVEGRKTEATAAEIDEIAELRRVVLEVTEPEPLSFTTT